ncbi:MAG: hypothetical protein N4A74_26120 [Carboxylicivirga sp.]|jgi:hypothetical protein|nr:hypothetical protein [Carboxylicivirga sp.]
MKSVIIILTIILLPSCISWQHVYHTIQHDVKTQDIIKSEVSEFIGIPEYSEDLETGELFIKTSLPGIVISSENFSFCKIPGYELTTMPFQIDKAYLFSNLVNRLLIIDSGNFIDKGSILGDLYTKQIEGLILKHRDIPDNYPPTTLTSPTYDDKFLLTLVNPVAYLPDSSWTVYQNNKVRIDTIRSEKNTLPVTIPAYNINMRIGIKTIERPWFKDDYLIISLEDKKERNRFAFIDGIILARNIRVENYSQSELEIKISRNGRRKKGLKVEPEQVIVSENTIILGYIYKLLN